jgi:hypothetical protein
MIADGTIHKFSLIMKSALEAFQWYGSPTNVETWQGADVRDRPDFETKEVLNFTFTYHMPDPLDLVSEVQPDLPWAENHFRERICGYAMNPGKAYKEWPWHTADPDRFLNKWGKFDFTYMERIWPPGTCQGVRFGPGNLSDVIALLLTEPHTRKAYLPLFFPEDTGRAGRTMCSLGYHFMRREDELHMWYHIRSCDFIRHFRNDVYMAIRMAQFVLGELRREDELWGHVKLGSLFFSAYSFHYHMGDQNAYDELLGEWWHNEPR